ncbi:MAG: UDP-3-O-acyl-N-acetylglucosamine deacetylase [Candidatus Margulisiibacteriota bacterium]|jgi:UDP-3-O-[3-hydroxymyristoyl] N-acetylglucosamine deacetylase
MQNQTIKKETQITGIGIHSGHKVTLTLKPASENHGIKFIRTDLNGLEIPVTPQNLVPGARATILINNNIKILTPEHLMASLYTLGINNLIIEINAEEVPIMDGSAKDFITCLKKAGIKKYPEKAKPLIISKPVFISENNAYIIGLPKNKLNLTYLLELNHSFIKEQFLSLEFNKKEFQTNIAPARTFGFYSEYQALLEKGLAKGANDENTVVIGEDKYLSALRFQDELVRHKLLDLLGDLATINRPIMGNIISFKGGHSLNSKFIQTCLSAFF